MCLLRKNMLRRFVNYYPTCITRICSRHASIPTGHVGFSINVSHILHRKNVNFWCTQKHKQRIMLLVRRQPTCHDQHKNFMKKRSCRKTRVERKRQHGREGERERWQLLLIGSLYTHFLSSLNWCLLNP